MKKLASIALLFLFATAAPAQNQAGALNMNGIATFEQLRKEYFIGALYLGWPGNDPATITNMPGRKRMVLHITADRWPPLRFAQQWNQLILINSDSALLNANVMDVLAFTGIPKTDLVAGDRLVIELNPDSGTTVNLNDTTVVRTSSPALFNLLLNTWIGPRPPSSEFKRDIIKLRADKAGQELVARFNTIQPSDARKKSVVAWGSKVEQETAPAAAAPAAAPKPLETVAVKAEPKPEPRPEPKAVASAAPAAAVAAAAPAKPVEVARATPPQPDPAIAAQRAREEQQKATALKAEQQQALYNDYLVQTRRQVNRNIEYPRRAVKDSLEGLVVLRVKLDRGGNLLDVALAQSAHDMLDRAAESAVRKAAPFPPAIAELEGQDFQFLVPIVFKLTQ